MLTRSEFTEWSMDDVLPALDGVKKGRNYEQGRLAYEAAQCAACHRFGNDGGSVGPDLTAISSRFSTKDILDSIIHPSKVLSEQYVYEKITTKDDEQYVGRIVGETAEVIEILENPYSEIRTSIKVSNIQSRENSTLSPMPEGLIQVLKKDEILDLLAYLESGGNPQSDNFK
jgi:putative heme-binding domain-containing protein